MPMHNSTAPLPVSVYVPHTTSDIGCRSSIPLYCCTGDCLSMTSKEHSKVHASILIRTGSTEHCSRARVMCGTRASTENICCDPGSSLRKHDKGCACASYRSSDTGCCSSTMLRCGTLDRLSTPSEEHSRKHARASNITNGNSCCSRARENCGSEGRLDLTSAEHSGRRVCS